MLIPFRHFCFASLGVIACLNDSTATKAAEEKAALPNFPIIIADDCTHRDIGCYSGQATLPLQNSFAIRSPIRTPPRRRTV